MKVSLSAWDQFSLDHINRPHRAVAFKKLIEEAMGIPEGVQRRAVDRSLPHLGNQRDQQRRVPHRRTREGYWTGHNPAQHGPSAALRGVRLHGSRGPDGGPGAALRRLIGTGSGIIFKGAGFRSTDYGSSAGGRGAGLGASCDRDRPCCGRDAPCERSPRLK